MSCNHAIDKDYSIKVVLPSDYIVKDYSCAFTLKGADSNSRYFCRTQAKLNTLNVSNFVTKTIPAQTDIIFTLDSIINPGTTETTKAITIATVDNGFN